MLYAMMAKDMDENGAVFLPQGETSQSLSLSDIFTLKDGTLTPVLKAANPPVRANVPHLSPEYSILISKSVKSILLPYIGKGKNSSMFHFSIFHASHHISPVPATETEIEGEASAIKIVAETICPLNIVLDRVLLTSTGVLLGCWQTHAYDAQVVSGTEPVTIRTKLKTAIPRAPEKQLYNEVILHTSLPSGEPQQLARGIYNKEGQKVSGLQIFHELVNRGNNQIRGMKATVSELWYVEEYVELALALNGKTKICRFHFLCSNA